MIDPEFERIRFVPVSERTEDENQYFIMKSQRARWTYVCRLE